MVLNPTCRGPKKSNGNDNGSCPSNPLCLGPKIADQ